MPKSPIFNLPNQLTGLRLLLAIVLFALIQHHLWYWSLAVFIVAAFTDWLDGYLARKLDLGSTLGRNLDPLVDKVLICGAYIFLLPVPNSGLTEWMATVVVARELIITSLRGFMENMGVSFGAELLGKAKMVLQCAALVAIFVVLELNDERLYVVRDFFIYAMLASTSISGLQYLYKAFAVLRK